MRARSILNRRAQTTGSTHKFKEIVQMCARNFAHIKKNTTFSSCFLVELLTTRKGGEIACKKRRRPQATSAPHGCKPCISFHCKMKWKIRERNSFTDCGAADQTWTGDLILTKDVLYRLSHSSVFINAQLLYWIRRNMSNEMSNKTKSRKNNLLRRL